MFAVSGDITRQSKSSRAGLQFSVGRFHRWMVDVRIAKFIHEYGSYYPFFQAFDKEFISPRIWLGNTILFLTNS